MKTFIAILALVAITIPSVAKNTTKSWTGYLVDKACAGRILKKHEGADAQANAQKHKVECALMEDCQATGFGVFVDGKYYKFDKKGDEKALAILQGTSRKDAFEVNVTGSMTGDKITVSEITEKKK